MQISPVGVEFDFVIYILYSFIMPLTENEKINQAIYNQTSWEYLERAGGINRNYWVREMDLFLKHLGVGKSVLEAGCGPATDGRHLLELGCSKVVSIDYAMGMMLMAQEILKDSYSKPKLSAMDIYSLGFPENSFNGFWATACLLHLENPQIALSEIKRVIVPGGIGFISVSEGNGKYTHPKTNIRFVNYKDEEFSQIISSCGMEIVYKDKAPISSKHDWLEYFVKVKK